MTTDIDAQKLAEIYKAMDERCEIICAVATRLLKTIDNQMLWVDGRPLVAVTPEMGHLMAELRQVMK